MAGHWRLIIFGVAAMVLGRLGAAEALFVFGLILVALGLVRFWAGRTNTGSSVPPDTRATGDRTTLPGESRRDDR